MILDDILSLVGDRLGAIDVACPICGPMRRSAVNRQRKVMRIWRLEPGFATFHCARCGEKGHTRDPNAAAPDPIKIAEARRAAEERDREYSVKQLAKARWLWSRRKPIVGSVAETYLREARGYRGRLPATLGFLPAFEDHEPAMIATFGVAGEPEPGLVTIADVTITGIHITRLLPDGSDKAGPNAKIMLARSIGSPIVLAPPNDLLGLAIAEGIENALSAHDSTGLGAWAAGAASRLPALADAVPNYIEAVTVYADDDRDGRRYGLDLATLLQSRGVEVHVGVPPKREAA